MLNLFICFGPCDKSPGMANLLIPASASAQRKIIVGFRSVLHLKVRVGSEIYRVKGYASGRKRLVYTGPERGVRPELYLGPLFDVIIDDSCIGPVTG